MCVCVCVCVYAIRLTPPLRHYTFVVDSKGVYNNILPTLKCIQYDDDDGYGLLCLRIGIFNKMYTRRDTERSGEERTLILIQSVL